MRLRVRSATLCSSISSKRRPNCRTMYPLPRKGLRPLSSAAPIIPRLSKRAVGYTAHFLPADRYVLLLVFSLLPSANFQWQFPRVEMIAQLLLPSWVATSPGLGGWSWCAYDERTRVKEYARGAR